MGIFIVIICLFFAYFAYKAENLWYNPATIMLSVWAFVLALYELRLFGLYRVSSTTYLLISIGLICFFFGYVLVSSANPVKYIEPPSDSESSEEGEHINYGILKICGIIVLAFFAAEAIETFMLLRSGVSLFEIRTSLQGYAEYDFSESLFKLRASAGILYTWFFLPVYNALMLIVCIDFFSGKRDKGLMFITLGCVLLKSFKEGSRVTLLIFVIYIVFALAIFKVKVNISKSIKRKIKFGIVILMVIMIVLSVVRISQGEKSLFEEIYLYFTCCIPLFDIWIDRFENSVTSTYNYGSLSLYGILQPLFVVLTIIKGQAIEWYNAGMKAISEIETFIRIRNTDYSEKANAFVTLFYYFYKDAGMIGLILGSTSFGMVCTAIYKNLKRKIVNGLSTKRAVYVYLLIIQSLILSFVRIYFSVASFSFTFFYVFLFISKSKVTEKKEVSVKEDEPIEE